MVIRKSWLSVLGFVTAAAAAAAAAVVVVVWMLILSSEQPSSSGLHGGSGSVDLLLWNRFLPGRLPPLLLRGHRGRRHLVSISKYHDPQTVQIKDQLVNKDDTNNNWNNHLTNAFDSTTGQEEKEAAAARSSSSSTTTLSNTNNTPIQICNRIAPIVPNVEMYARQEYYTNYCTQRLQQPPEQTSILLLEGMKTFGRTGNNIIEFLHALQYGIDHNVHVGIVHRSWPTHLITQMWMAIQEKDTRKSWEQSIEQSFCIKMINSNNDPVLNQYKEVIRMDTRDLFMYRYQTSLDQYVKDTSHVLRTLWRSYNHGGTTTGGRNMQHDPVPNMCSVMDAIFGTGSEGGNDDGSDGGGGSRSSSSSSFVNSAIYSVVHSRSFEGVAGHPLMDRIAASIGCDPVAALEMEPDYIKGILEPLGMMKYPIYFISDHQRPEIFERLQSDPEIGPRLHLIPQEASWIGGDITLATLANVFIGSPASTFSGFIAKSRVALGYNNNYLFRKQIKDGTWVEVCDYRCVFDKDVLKSMA